ncbi:Transposable element Tcb1 transposase [Araneus ventricosus]|uniref:Transposable element Tcb1 transposase n=1 Tax=Araneus ventricosus TaxID=182803 RepID=A0A4Y2QNB0_ARAVE|nr:Transposable element Tcb1 transposase [Araneus ventricosus]GBN64844.1 Transposable element Tcb1 transposase [Araneus ventricosus]
MTSKLFTIDELIEDKLAGAKLIDDEEVIPPFFKAAMDNVKAYNEFNSILNDALNTRRQSAHESRFLLHRIDGYWRICGETSENKLPETIVGLQQGGGGNVMVRGMISFHDLGPLTPVEGTLDSCAYLSIVADHVHPYVATVYSANDGMFQQDNATCLVSKIVRAWFEEHDEEFQLLPWPPNSPDLNPCENLWEHLDRLIRQKDPPPRNLHELRDVLLFSWSQMPVATFQAHIESMTRRLTAVLAARGGHSGY